MLTPTHVAGLSKIVRGLSACLARLDRRSRFTQNDQARRTCKRLVASAKSGLIGLMSRVLTCAPRLHQPLRVLPMPMDILRMALLLGMVNLYHACSWNELQRESTAINSVPVSRNLRCSRYKFLGVSEMFHFRLFRENGILPQTLSWLRYRLLHHFFDRLSVLYGRSLSL